MMTLDVIVIVFVLTLFFWRAAADNDRAELASPVPAAPGGGAATPTHAGARPAGRAT